MTPKVEDQVTADPTNRSKPMGTKSLDNLTETTDDDDIEICGESPQFSFPQALYDPITLKLLANPVVAPCGDSYEKMDHLDPSIAYYPNRALQAYIEEELSRYEADSGSVRGKLLQWGKSVRSGLQHLAEHSPLPLGDFRPLSDAFYCPISFDLMHVPVIDPDGHSYERAAIVHWLRSNKESPITRNPLSVDQLRDNCSLLRVIEHWTLEKDESLIHPSIRQWKQEHAARVLASAAVTDTTTTNTITNNTPLEMVEPASLAHTETTATFRSGPHYASTPQELAAARRARTRGLRIMQSLLLSLLFANVFFRSYFLFFCLLTCLLIYVTALFAYTCHDLRFQVRLRRHFLATHSHSNHRE